MKGTLGITGGMGAGKTRVCKAFAAQGIPVYDCDSRVKDILNDNDFLKSIIKSKFGDGCYKNDLWIASMLSSSQSQIRI